jgi:hypothetical protein
LKNRILVTLAAVLFLTCLTIPARADQFVYTLTIDHCTGGCGVSPFGTITVTDVAANQVSLAVNMLPHFLVHTGGGANGGSTIAFNLTGNPNNLTLLSSSLPGWSLDAASAGSIQFDGFGDFEYSLNCCNSQNGGANAQVGNNTVTLSGTGLTAASFQELSSGGSPSVYFAVDILSATTGNTGPVGTNGTPTTGAVPEPTSVVLLGSIAALLVHATRRKLVA